MRNDEFSFVQIKHNSTHVALESICVGLFVFQVGENDLIQLGVTEPSFGLFLVELQGLHDHLLGSIYVAIVQVVLSEYSCKFSLLPRIVVATSSIFN